MIIRPLVKIDGRETLYKSNPTRLLEGYNFSYKKIVSGLDLEIPVNQQMNVRGDFTVFAGGNITVPSGAELSVEA